tara:strand:+ start:396 stop:1325 length:930 start_codon:yes stop_codon:yes gene_type:complete
MYEDHRIFVKHLSALDLGNIEEKDKQVYNEAKSQGLPTEEQQLKLIIEQGIWSQAKEKDIVNLEQELDRVRTALDKLIVKSQIQRQRQIIDKLAEKIFAIQKEKKELLGLTCEVYAKKQMNQEYLKYSLRTDSNLEHRYLDDEKYDSIADPELDTITILYNAVIHQITEQTIKRVAAHPFFLNSFLICKNDPSVLFGKAVCYMSNYQIDLFANAQRFKGVLEQGKNPPSSMYDNIQSVVDWYESQLGTKNVMKSDAAGGTVFGATEEEMRNMVGSEGSDRDTVSLNKEFKKTGKKQLNMKDMLKLHGEI